MSLYIGPFSRAEGDENILKFTFYVEDAVSLDVLSLLFCFPYRTAWFSLR